MKEKQRKYYIYSIRNTTKGHERFGFRYIGLTKNGDGIRKHRRDKNQLGDDIRNPDIKFDRRVLWTGVCTFKEIIQTEKFYIEKYKSRTPFGYNRNHGGGGVLTHSAESRKKMSVISKKAWSNPKKKLKRRSAMKGKLKPGTSKYVKENNPMKRPEIAAKHGQTQKGNQHAKGKHWKLSTTICEKMRVAHIGIKLSPKHCAKIGEANIRATAKRHGMTVKKYLEKQIILYQKQLKISKKQKKKGHEKAAKRYQKRLTSFYKVARHLEHQNLSSKLNIEIGKPKTKKLKSKAIV